MNKTEFKVLKELFDKDGREVHIRIKKGKRRFPLLTKKRISTIIEIEITDEEKGNEDGK